MTLFFDAEIIGPWVSELSGGAWIPHRGTCIGQFDNEGSITAGVIYEDFNGANVVCHIAGVGHWANKRYLWAIFDYPFVQMRVKRITVIIKDSNKKSIALVEKMGFTIEARLAQATPDGDLLIYRLFKDDCKYIKGKYGKIKSTTASSNT